LFVSDDTIVAIATPHGRGGIGVVRLSGPGAVVVASAMLRPPPDTPRHATFSRLVHADNGEVIDQVVATWFAAPHSFTGEDVVEISAHGSPVLLAEIVRLAMGGGARLAEPGEFTFRAYLNQRIDLPQAEAVADLVDAVTPLQARVAMDQLEGTLTEAIGRIDAAMFDVCARLEASLDFPDEGFHFISRADAAGAIARLRESLDRLTADGRTGRVIREGRTVVIAGQPNAGKSSLFNVLLGTARAIVTDIPGTTRDLLTERVAIEGLAVTLVDTAGLREARDAIEAEGVQRARDVRRVAALTLVVIDGSTPLTAADRALVTAVAGEPHAIVISKADLPHAWAPEELGAGPSGVVRVSTVTGDGIEALRRQIARTLAARDDLRDPPAITNVRHLALVDEARDAVVNAEGALSDGATEELVLTDLTRARQALEQITGRRTSEDVIREIFARFCIGK
jgi:tRNA modification GTPase